MSIPNILLTLGVTGFILWVINKVIPMEPVIKTILNAVVILFVVFWLLKILGLLIYLKNLTT